MRTTVALPALVATDAAIAATTPTMAVITTTRSLRVLTIALPPSLVPAPCAVSNRWSKRVSLL
jgi:hypothetical protein